MRATELPELVIEIANSHGGDAGIIEALVSAAAALDYPRKAIKFQVLDADAIAMADFPYHALYQKLAFDAVTWARLIDRAAQDCSVHIDVFDTFSTQVLSENLARVSAIKLQASVLENQEVLGALASLALSDKAITINVSGYEIDEIGAFVARFRALSERLTLQIGFQSYPTALEDTALGKIAVLAAAFPGCRIGLADHADAASDFAQLAPIHGYLLGCQSIEKHMCLERASAPFDGSAALEPDQMQQLCNRLVDLDRARGQAFINEAEKRYLASTIQRPLSRHALSPGARIGLSDLMFRRTSQTGASWSEIRTAQENRLRPGAPIAAHRTFQIGEFRPARVGALVAARMKSSRLPRKALLPLDGTSTVERCLIQCFGASGIDEVILATSVLEDDQVLKDHTLGGRAHYWTGDPDDVISRYLGACDAYGLDVIVRVTADCPLVSPEIIDHLLEAHFRSGADYTAARQAAVGTPCEIIEVSALREVVRNLKSAQYSEYMTWYFQNNPDVFDLNIVDLPAALVRDYRLTLDYPEDLTLFEGVYGLLKPGDSAVPLTQVFEVLDNDPALARVNAGITQKYHTDQNLIDRLNKATRITVSR